MRPVLTHRKLKRRQGKLKECFCTQLQTQRMVWAVGWRQLDDEFDSTGTRNGLGAVKLADIDKTDVSNA